MSSYYSTWPEWHMRWISKSIRAYEWAVATALLANQPNGSKLKRTRPDNPGIEHNGKQVRLTHSFMKIDGHIYAFSAKTNTAQGQYASVNLVENQARKRFVVKIRKNPTAEPKHQREYENDHLITTKPGRPYTTLKRETGKTTDLLEYYGPDLQSLHRAYWGDCEIFDFDRAYRLAITLANIIHEWHTVKGICHLDVKPENICIQNGHVTIIDVGLSEKIRGPRDPSQTDFLKAAPTTRHAKVRLPLWMAENLTYLPCSASS